MSTKYPALCAVVFFLFSFLALAQSGSEVWVRRAPELEHEDRITAMAKDADGNVYVTGYSWSTQSNFDFLTIKYDSAGTELWRVRYDNPSVRGDDRAAAIVVRDIEWEKTSQRYVWVTGPSQGGATAMDYATVVYDARTGERSPVWSDVGAGVGVRRFDGHRRDDEARALVVDIFGTVYVIGTVTLDEEIFPRRVYGTVSYLFDGARNPFWPERPHNPDLFHLGEPQGVRYYTWSMERVGGKHEEATAIALFEESGIPLYVHVTGKSYGPHSYGFATVKYDVWTGEESARWPALDYDNRRGVRRWDDPRGSGQARAIAVDANGHVVVTGSVLEACGGITICDSPKQTDAKGIFLAGSCAQYGTAKYAETGEIRWQRTYHPFGVEDNRKMHQATALTLDRDGQVYVAGYSNRFNTVCPQRIDDHDWVMIKYRSSDDPDDGTQLWLRREDGPPLGTQVHDAAYAITADAKNGIYVTGGTAGFWSPDAGPFERFGRMTTRRYGSLDGSLLWTHHYDFNPGPYFDNCGKAIVVVEDPWSKENTGVYSGGYSFGYDFLTVKIRP